MATPARIPEGLPHDIFLRKGPVDQADRDWLFAQGARNCDYLHARRDGLIREHRGKWAIVYGDCQLAVGEDRADLRRGISIDDLRVACMELLDDVVEYPSFSL